MALPDDLVMRMGAAMDELPHNSTNWDKARAALSVAWPECVEMCAKIAEDFAGTTDDRTAEFHAQRFVKRGIAAFIIAAFIRSLKQGEAG